MAKMIKINPIDNVATSLSTNKLNETAIIVDKTMMQVDKIISIENIAFANKIALVDIEKDGQVLKYGEVIGIATKDIKKGSLVHVHNVRSTRLDIPKQIIKEIMKQMDIKE